MINYKISLCTVCMNRLHHLKRTLQKNIEENIDYPNVEYILLDYGSEDGLEEWVRENFGKYIESKKLIFYRTSDPKYFDRSHSRNLMFKLSSGDIICNIDADNYTGESFAKYVNTIFNINKDIYLVADTKKRFYFLRNAFGRFCIKKEDFITIGGLDEKMKSYGSETLDLYERLNIINREEVVIENTNFLRTISHGDEERISNEFFIKSLFELYIRYISIEESEILILYKNNIYEKCNIIPEKINTYLPAALKEDSLIKGNWSKSNNRLSIENGKETIQYEISDSGLHLINDSSAKFDLITDERLLMNIAKNYSFITNTDKLLENVTNKNFLVNDGEFGKGKVVKNFKEEMIVV